MNATPKQTTRWPWLLVPSVAVLVVAAAGAGYFLLQPEPPAQPPRPPIPRGDVTAQVHAFCGACHPYPPPDTFPRRHWKEEVGRGYEFFSRSGMALQPPPIDEVVKYYQDRAPEELPALRPEKATTPLPVHFEQVRFPGPPETREPTISHVSLVRLFDDRRLDVLACEMRAGLVMALQPYEKSPSWRVLGKVPNPARAEVVDLDRDGVPDLLVANLGNLMPTDRRCGSVEWLRGRRDGQGQLTFDGPITLLADVGRVADVQAADFRGTGKLDLIVAAFGWKEVGEVYFLENQTTDWSKPSFAAHVLDERHGAIHVPVTDLDGDGRPDFVALISQEHETVVAFLNQGGGRFRKEPLFAAAHPAYGSSGIVLADMDGDGDLDVLYTNGDTLDQPYLLKPYHGVQWLENPGKGRFPWKHHPITALYGAHRAVAADLTGSGRMDVLAVSFLSATSFRQRAELGLDAVLLLEQTGPGRFVRHSLEAGSCDHVTCAVGDIYGRGRIDLVTAVFTPVPSEHALVIWKNLGPGPMR